MKATIFKNQMNLAQRLYAPSVETMISNLPAMGKSLNDACLALADDCNLPRIDDLVSRFKTAEQTLTRLRLAMASEKRVSGDGMI